MVGDDSSDLVKWLIFLLLVSICLLSIFSVIKLTPEIRRPPNPCLFPSLDEEGVALDVCLYVPCSYECDRKWDRCLPLSYTKEGVFSPEKCNVNRSECLKQCSSRYTQTIGLDEYNLKIEIYESNMEKKRQLFEMARGSGARRW